MYRPYDWAPLAASDPLPGDPDSILYEAGRLRNMATEITRQVETLRKIGAVADDQQGQFTEALRDSAGELAEKLEKVIDRYAKVSEYLYAWAPELEDFQAKTLRALDKALDAERQRARDPHSDLQTTGFTYMGIHAGALPETPARDAADLVLAEARRELAFVLHEAAERDRHWGSLIGHAIDDNLTDGWRDHLHHWIERHHGMVKGLTEALGYVTTGVALAAIAFPPLAGVAIGLTYANMAVHTAEYVGGDGSLLDVVLDAGALRGMRYARGISEGLEDTFKATRLAASEAARRDAAEAVRRSASEDVLQAQKALDDKVGGAVGRRAQELVGSFHERQLTEGNDAAARIMERPSERVGVFKAFVAGSREDAHYVNDSRHLLREFADDDAVQRAGGHLGREALKGEAAFLTATAVDTNDKSAMVLAHVVPEQRYVRGYNQWKERFVMSGGSVE